MGSCGIVACTAAVLTDKGLGAEDKKKLNGAIAASSLISRLVCHQLHDAERCQARVRAMNIATNLGIGAYALKEALGK